ncbi:pancreatic lipase-related protein 2-like [Spodoptera litura]|uniref:Pancreatic lipase-related protein 2-like n=1 Tax=Spodoptera litura TaxID=69820 RepID=A0A9J7DT03_SPOLT|nr:pancreatic lipase-related protein 2-like [Spodoptera litura]
MKWILCFLSVVLTCRGQRPASLPFGSDSFRTIVRGLSTAPGRSAVVDDIIIRYFSTNVTSPSSYRIANIKAVLSDPAFDVKKPTVLYAHGYVELLTDDSLRTVVSAYLKRGGYNILVLDWSNLAFGNYVVVAKTLPHVGEFVGKSVYKLVKQGLPVQNLHLVGHSLGSHICAYIARYLSARGSKVPRLTGLDPAYPGFYPPLAAPPMTPEDADFVDVIHTDGGGYGAPDSTGHADFWPNGGQAKQPGCLSATIFLSNEDFCSHWRSWEFWSESLLRDDFLARPCADYDTFLRGQCSDQPLVFMGIRSTPDLRGNFYLITGTKSPFGLNVRGCFRQSIVP